MILSCWVLQLWIQVNGCQSRIFLNRWIDGVVLVSWEWTCHFAQWWPVWFINSEFSSALTWFLQMSNSEAFRWHLIEAIRAWWILQNNVLHSCFASECFHRFHRQQILADATMVFWFDGWWHSRVSRFNPLKSNSNWCMVCSRIFIGYIGIGMGQNLQPLNRRFCWCSIVNNAFVGHPSSARSPL